MNSPSSDAPLLFVRSFLCDPKRIGALAPSSPRLSRLMASRVEHSDDPVVEIGAGTGVITRQILERGVRPERLVVIERDPSLAQHLRDQFPQVRVRCCDARHAPHMLRSEDLGQARTVVSSLPLRNLSRHDGENTVRAMMDALTPEGQLIQFTYAAGCPVSTSRLGLKAECLGRVWRNLPPAAVWRFTFASSARSAR